MKTEATHEKTPEPTPEEIEWWSHTVEVPPYLDSQNQDTEYLENVKMMREKLEEMWAENPDSRPDFRFIDSL